jgi:hypothetical protein
VRRSGWALSSTGPLVADLLIRIALIILLAFAAYRLLKLLTRRLQKEVDEPDLVRKRLREQRAQTVASLLNNMGLMTIAGWPSS